MEYFVQGEKVVERVVLLVLQTEPPPVAGTPTWTSHVLRTTHFLSMLHSHHPSIHFFYGIPLKTTLLLNEVLIME